jgi:hypothetical protein
MAATDRLASTCLAFYSRALSVERTAAKHAPVNPKVDLATEEEVRAEKVGAEVTEEDQKKRK